MWKPVSEKAIERERLNKIAFESRGALFEVYKTLGPGFIEAIYEEAVIIELRRRGLNVLSQVAITVFYKGIELQRKQKIDLLVEESVIVELKAVDELHPKHRKQLTSQLRSADKRLGYLVNFNCEFMKDGRDLIRVVNDF